MAVMHGPTFHLINLSVASTGAWGSVLSLHQVTELMGKS